MFTELAASVRLRWPGRDYIALHTAHSLTPMCQVLLCIPRCPSRAQTYAAWPIRGSASFWLPWGPAHGHSPVERAQTLRRISLYKESTVSCPAGLWATQERVPAGRVPTPVLLRRSDRDHPGQRPTAMSRSVLPRHASPGRSGPCTAVPEIRALHLAYRRKGQAAESGPLLASLTREAEARHLRAEQSGASAA